jgi:hypothetical protein
MLETWEEFPNPSAAYTAGWDFVYERLQFRPSTYSEQWPGILEPSPSVTYDIHHIYGHGDLIAIQLENDLNQNTLAALRSCTQPHQRLYALDWQHPCYWFYPHREFDHLDQWRVPVLPNGDYYIFLAEDFSFGIFGHPWEQTMCIFGQSLLNAFSQHTPALFSHRIRVDGLSVDKSMSSL